MITESLAAELRKHLERQDYLHVSSDDEHVYVTINDPQNNSPLSLVVVKREDNELRFGYDKSDKILLEEPDSVERFKNRTTLEVAAQLAQQLTVAERLIKDRNDEVEKLNSKLQRARQDIKDREDYRDRITQILEYLP